MKSFTVLGAVAGLCGLSFALSAQGAPDATVATYNAIPSKDKKFYHGIGGVHGSPNAPEAAIRAWLAE